jgi:L-alanine-DL-glutamate epimerase-like enolase superfamily enzyme
VKITRLETVWLDEHPNNLWLQIHTDDGLIGLGETFYVPRAVSAMIHDVLAKLLLGREAFDIENHWTNLYSTVSFFGFAGTEMRAISAVDIALWDLLGQYTGQPIYNLLGGRSRDRIPVYNTCVGHGAYGDYRAWSEGDAGELAKDLLKDGIRAMKIWPWDQFGVSLGGPIGSNAGVEAVGPVGHYLRPEKIKQGLKPIESIRKAVGGEMQIAIEGHAKWNLPISIQIAQALEPYEIMWLEEVLPADNIECYSRLAAATRIPLCASERLITRFGFRDLVEQNAAQIIMPDIVWTGGITETRKIACLADTYHLPFTTHDTVGPVAVLSAAHLALHARNAMIMETVRAYYLGWYRDIITEPLQIKEGHLTLPPGPGLGARLRPEVLSRADAHIESTPAK